MIQARFTNYGRFSCMAMLEFASEQDNAAAGTDNVKSARLDNPENYVSPFDRNWVLYFATIFTESLQKEVGNKANLLNVNVLEFWQQQCEEPAAFRAPVPTSMWAADAERLGTTDAFGTSVEVRDFAPLVSFGSLRQLRSADGAAAMSWPEDASTSSLFYSTNVYTANRYSSDEIDYFGRRRRLVQDAANATAATSTIYNANGVSLSSEPAKAPGETRRGRKLFMAFIVQNLISKSLGLTPAPITDIKKQFNFEVPTETRPHFYFDHIARETPLPKDMLRDVICNPDYDLNVEQVVGDPPPHADRDWILDSSTAQSPRDMVTPGFLRGGDVNRGYTTNGPGGSTPSYKDTSLQSWVYLTSSDDPSVKMYVYVPLEPCQHATHLLLHIPVCFAAASIASPILGCGQT